MTRPSELACWDGVLACEMCVVICTSANMFMAAIGTSSAARQRANDRPVSQRRVSAISTQSASRATPTTVASGTLRSVQPCVSTVGSAQLNALKPVTFWCEPAYWTTTAAVPAASAAAAAAYPTSRQPRTRSRTTMPTMKNVTLIASG